MTVGFIAAEKYLDFDGHPSTVYDCCPPPGASDSGALWAVWERATRTGTYGLTAARRPGPRGGERVLSGDEGTDRGRRSSPRPILERLGANDDAAAIRRAEDVLGV